MSITNRREFLISSAPLLAAPFLLPVLSSKVEAAEVQVGWRFCSKCHSLFWGGGGSDKAPCAAGGIHAPSGFVFQLPYNVPGTSNAQSNWRFCDKCFGMFWNGYPDKGRCSSGGTHRVFGFDYVLPHGVATNSNYQDKWRFCGKCKALFYDGYAAKGRCPAGAGHAAIGYMFVLGHSGAGPPPPPEEYRVKVDLHTDGWAPIRGWMELTAKPNGDHTFAGHMHNSGAINIRFTLAVALASPPGRQSFAFAVSNKLVQGTEVLIGRNRDYDWKQSGNDPHIAGNWGDFRNARVMTRLVAGSTFGERLRGYLDNLVRETYGQIPTSPLDNRLLKPMPLRVILSL